VKPEPPAVTKDGLSEVIAGPAAIVNVAGTEVTPPLVTVIPAVPAVAISPAATVAVNWLMLPNAVGNAEPFQFTTAPEANPLPFTVSGKPEPPAVTEDGDNELSETGEVIVIVMFKLAVTPLASDTLIVEGNWPETVGEPVKTASCSPLKLVFWGQFKEIPGAAVHSLPSIRKDPEWLLPKRAGHPHTKRSAERRTVISKKGFGRRAMGRVEAARLLRARC
jgi:hypothetical protein